MDWKQIIPKLDIRARLRDTPDRRPSNSGITKSRSLDILSQQGRPVNEIAENGHKEDELRRVWTSYARLGKSSQIKTV